jgi:hypothetical protein
MQYYINTLHFSNILGKCNNQLYDNSKHENIFIYFISFKFQVTTLPGDG